MNKAIIQKCIAEAAILLIACAGALLLFSWFRVWIVGELDTTRFQQILELLPEDWRRFSPVEFEWLISYTGRTSLTLDEPLLVMLIAIWAIVRGSDVVSGEVNRGTMEMLLAQPISRRQIYLTQSTVTVLGVVALVLVAWFGMWLGIATTTVQESTYPEIRVPLTQMRIPLTFLPPNVEAVRMSQRVSAGAFAPGIVNLFLLGFFLSGISAAVSACDRYRWRTLGIVVGFYMAGAMLKILGLASETFGWVLWLTFFTCYEPEAMVQMGEVNPSALWQLLTYDDAGQLVGLGALGRNVVLFGLGAISYAVGLLAFERRDLPAPL